MKRFSVSLCLLACLVVTSSCDMSSVKNLSLSIRRYWKGLTETKSVQPVTVPATKAEAEAIARLQPVPGEPLSEEEKIRLVKAQAFIAACPKSAAEAGKYSDALVQTALNLNKLYPPAKPIDAGDLSAAFRSPMPEQIGAYRFVGKDIVPQLAVVSEELLPNGYFEKNPSYYSMVASHAGSNGRFHSVYVIDRGSFGAWARTAAWYYTRKGFVSQSDSERYQFSGTMEEDGRTWAVWKRKKGEGKMFVTWWNDRFMVWVEGYDSPSVVEEVFNTGWMDNVQ